MIESGTTTFADMYYFEEEIAKATVEAGLRGVLGETIIQFPVADAKTPADALARAERFIKEFKDERPDRAGGRAARALHERQGDARRGARRWRASTTCRSSFTSPRPKTRSRSRASSIKLTPTAVPGIDRLLGPTTLAAHGVWVNDDDIAILKRRGVGVVAQPGKQHEAGERHRAGRRSIWPPASRSVSAPTAPPATTISTCSRRCARRRSSPSTHARSDRGAGADGARPGDDRRRAGARAWRSRSDRSSRASAPISSPSR